MSKEILHAARRSVRILVVDQETLIADRLVAFLKSHGFDTAMARSSNEVIQALANYHPHVIIYDLMFPEINGLGLLKRLRTANLLGESGVKVLMMSGHNNPSNVKETLKMGAVDFLVKPIRPPELLGRLVFHLQKKREVPEFNPQNSKDFDSAQYFLSLLDMMMKEMLVRRDIEPLLHKITAMMAIAMKAVRVSVVRCDLENRRGEVLASNDKEDIDRFQLDLVKYPEILYVLRNEKMLALDNLATDPTMHFLTKKEKSVNFSSMVVAPIRIAGAIWGVISIRMPEAKERVTDYEIRFCQAAGHLCGIVALRHPSLSQCLVLPPLSDAG